MVKKERSKVDLKEEDARDKKKEGVSSWLDSQIVITLHKRKNAD